MHGTILIKLLTETLRSRIFPFVLTFPYFFPCRCWRGVFIFNQYEFCMCVKVMFFAWKMTACRYGIWCSYFFSLVIESNVEFSLCFSNVLYVTFDAFQQVNDILTPAIKVMIDLKYSVRLVASNGCCMHDLFTAQSSVVC